MKPRLIFLKKDNYAISFGYSYTARHAAIVATLPDIHRDPFDRLLIAQTICEPLTFLTADMQLKKYSKLVECI